MAAHGSGVPVNKISVQLWTFAEYRHSVRRRGGAHRPFDPFDAARKGFDYLDRVTF